MDGTDLWAGGNRKCGHVGNQTVVWGGGGHKPASVGNIPAKHGRSLCFGHFSPPVEEHGDENTRVWFSAVYGMFCSDMQQMTCGRGRSESVCGQASPC